MGENSNEFWLREMRERAAELVSEKGTVTADDLRPLAETLECDGIRPTSQNAWGVIFRSGDFRFTGQLVKSVHGTNRARKIKVWGAA